MPGFVRVEMEERLAIVTINRPDALNALNSAVLRELSMAIEHLSMAADVGAIILTGAGTPETERQMYALGVNEFVEKEFSLHRLGDALTRALKPPVSAV